MKFGSTLVDLLGNISNRFGQKLVKKLVKMGKNATFLEKIFYIRDYRQFLADLDAINWDRESLHDVFEVLKFWSTLVDLLGNISTL